MLIQSFLIDQFSKRRIHIRWIHWGKQETIKKEAQVIIFLRGRAIYLLERHHQNKWRERQVLSSYREVRRS
jgi:hypothetical protein